MNTDLNLPSLVAVDAKTYKALTESYSNYDGFDDMIEAIRKGTALCKKREEQTKKETDFPTTQDSDP